MFAMLLATIAFGIFGTVTGLRPSLAVVAVGAWGMALWLTIVNGIYTTIVQVKVPQRFHGRVFALNTLIAWSTLPLGFGLVAPYGTRLFEPLARHLSPLVGTGPGRGIGLMYVLFGLVIALFAVGALASRTLGRFDDEVPDAMPDDLVGVEALRRRTGRAAGQERALSAPGPAGSTPRHGRPASR
jgi:hypothetical protein